MDTSVQRPKFHHWTAQERDLWTDFLESYSGCLLDPDTTEEHAHERVKLAARLADTAITEMQYRFWVQHPDPGLMRTPRRATPPRRRRARSR